VTSTLAVANGSVVDVNVRTPMRSPPGFAAADIVTCFDPVPEAGDTVNHGSELDAVHAIVVVTHAVALTADDRGTVHDDKFTVRSVSAWGPGCVTGTLTDTSGEPDVVVKVRVAARGAVPGFVPAVIITA